MENKKVKIEIKNRFTGDILFEYEKEDNTIKETIEKAMEEGANLEGAYLEGAYLERAYLRGADLRGADLRGADLRGAYLRGAYLRGAYLEGANLEGAYLRGAYLEGANLEGAYLYLWNNSEPNVENLIKNLEDNCNIEIKKTYINKHILSPYLNYWKNGLIIDEYEIKKSKRKMTLKEIEKELGYEVEIVEEVE